MTKKADGRRFGIPTTHDDCNLAIQLLGNEQRRIVELTAERDTQLASLKASYDRQIAEVEARAEALTDGIQEFCEVRRRELTGDGRKKSFRFAAGEVAWRNRPPSVTVRRVQAAIEFCLAEKGLLKFLRTKHKINKDALRDDPETAATIPGVKIGSAGEDFYVEPFEPKPTDRPAQAAA